MASPDKLQDRVSEAYYGDLWSERQTRRLRDRVHWLCGQARGRVLDVGCSQGIVSILLAREGHEVVAIDSLSSAVDFAKSQLAQELPEVQARVDFRCCELRGFEDKGSFDTIVLGEVLEHQADPLKFLGLVGTHIRNGGQIVVTTPFGYDPHGDHKSTIFPSWFLEFGELPLSVTSLEVTQGNIRAVVTWDSRSSEQRAPSRTFVLRLTERGTRNSQKRLYAIAESASERERDLNAHLGTLDKVFEDTNSEWQQRLANIERGAAIAEKEHRAEVKKLQRRIAAAERVAAQRLDGVVDQLAEEVRSLNGVHGVLTENLDSLSNTSNALSRYRQLPEMAAKVAEVEKLEQAGDSVIRHAVRLAEANRKLSDELNIVRSSASFVLGHEFVTTRGAGVLSLPWRLFRGILDVKKSRSSDTTDENARVNHKSLDGGGFVTRTTPTWIVFDVVPMKTYVFSWYVSSFGESVSKGTLLEIMVEDDDGKALPFETSFLKHRSQDNSGFVFVETASRQLVRAPLTMPAGAKRVVAGWSRYGADHEVYVSADNFRPLKRGEEPPEPVGIVLAEGLKQTAIGASKDGNPPVAAVLDTFSRECFAPELDLISVTKSDWRHEISRRQPMAFFAESAWRGNEGEWRYAFNKTDKWGQELVALIDYCRSKGIPSVFWNKEDPVNFDEFAGVAQLFDYVFTTDDGCVSRYREELGIDNVGVLPFAAQPQLHNPIRYDSIIDRFAFTGSWRGVKYPERARWLDVLLSPLVERGVLDIYDRFAGETNNPDLIFPPKLALALKGSLEYKELVDKVYKRYLAFVNVNSVESSNTMLARRVFELLACGAPVISSPSPAIQETFGDVVQTPATGTEVSDLAERLLSDWLYRESLATKGVRLVHGGHTYRHRVEKIAERIGRPFSGRSSKRVSIVCVSKRRDQIEHVAKQIDRQLYSNIEIVFVAHGEEDWSEEISHRLGQKRDLKILRIGAGHVLADGLNAAMRVASGEYCAKFDDDDHYGENYLLDAMQAFEYTNGVGVVGKRSFFAYLEDRDLTVIRFKGNEYRYSKLVHGGTLVWDRTKTEGIEFERVVRGTDTRFLKACVEREVPIFSSDPFNFVHVRHADLDHHTWKIGHDEFMERSEPVEAGLALEKVFV